MWRSKSNAAFDSKEISGKKNWLNCYQKIYTDINTRNLVKKIFEKS